MPPATAPQEQNGDVAVVIDRLSKHFGSASATRAKAEIETNEGDHRLKLLDQNIADEFFVRNSGKRFVERTEHYVVDSGAKQQTEFFLGSGQIALENLW